MVGTISLLLLAVNGLADGINWRTPGAKLTHKLAQEAVGYSDLNAMAAAVGIDYPVLVERALDGKRGAIFLLLWMAGNAPLDGAGSDEYTDTMFRVAQKIGDKTLSDVAKSLNRASLGPLREAFLFEYGGTDEPKAASDALQKDFPMLCSVIAAGIGEQGAAGQPATRPESKSEGGQNPLPTSEGRAR